MKLNKILLGMGAILPVALMAQTGIKSTTPEGYFTRGVSMYGNQNYEGTIDQLSHLRLMPATAKMDEEAQLGIAFSLYQQGRPACVDALRQFLTEHPFSLLAPRAWATLGNYYFFNGKYGEAVTAYANVSETAFDSDTNEDLIYRDSYSQLRLANYEAAKAGFRRLSASSRYKTAAQFYDAYILYANGDYEAALAAFQKVDRRGELGYNAQYYMCQIYFRQGEFAKVLSSGRALLADNNGSAFDSEINRLLGETYYHENDDEAVYKHITKYLETNESAPLRTAEYILGVLDYRKGDYDLAVEHLGDVTQEDSALGQSAYFFIGQSYRKTDNKPMASMAFEKACKMEFDRSTQEAAFYNYAVMQNEGSRTPFSKTIDMFEDFLNRFPNSKYTNEVEEYMVTVYMTGNDYQRALTSISHIKNPSATVLKAKQSVLYNLGVQALSDNKTQTAQKYFTEARDLSKYGKETATQSELWLGECYYRAGKYAQAEKCQKNYLQGASAKDSNFALGNYNLGYSRFQQRKYADARTAFQSAIKNGGLSDKLKADANNRIGDTYYYGKDYASAESYYDKSYGQNKNGGDYALFQKGIMLGLGKNYNGKVNQMDALLRQYPSSTLAPTAMLEQAGAYVLLGNGKKAVDVYEDLVKRYPASADARKGLLQLAITQRNLGSESQAIAAYKKVISKYPTSEEAGVAAEDLKLVYADKGQLQEFASFINNVPNAPKLDVSEIDRLTFESAEKAYMAEKSDVTKMRGYLKKYPNGAYASHAKYYLAKYDYKHGNDADALTAINGVLASNGDASFAEDALAIKSDILLRQGKNSEALATYKTLSKKASTADNRITAQLGVMRTSLKMERYSDVVASADELLKSSGLSADEEKEATFSRAMAYTKLNKGAQAAKDFAQLAKNPQNLYGAQAAYQLGQQQFNAGDLNTAEKTVNALIDAGTPHQYWLARGFILLADIYHKKGKDFDACEYLESLKSNYPGKDADIFKMIDERLGSWKTAAKTTTKSNKKK